MVQSTVAAWYLGPIQVMIIMLRSIGMPNKLPSSGPFGSWPVKPGGWQSKNISSRIDLAHHQGNQTNNNWTGKKCNHSGAMQCYASNSKEFYGIISKIWGYLFWTKDSANSSCVWGLQSIFGKSVSMSFGTTLIDDMYTQLQLLTFRLFSQCRHRHPYLSIFVSFFCIIAIWGVEILLLNVHKFATKVASQ